jgi:hypothetical protein
MGWPISHISVSLIMCTGGKYRGVRQIGTSGPPDAA